MKPLFIGAEYIEDGAKRIDYTARNEEPNSFPWTVGL